MKRIRKIIFFVLFIMLFIPFTMQKVYAADCSDVMDAVNRLDNIDNDYLALKCDEANDTQTIYKCNKLLIERSSVLEEIFEYNDEHTCPSIDLSSIISDHEKKCTNRYSSKLKVVTDTVMKFFYITAPFILLIFGSLDFFKIVVGTPEQIRKHRTNFIKRLVAFLLLYITPFVVETLFSVTPYNINGVKYICAEEISLSPKITTATDAEGIYGGNNNGGEGQAIAEAAKEIKENAIKNGYTWGCNSLSPDKQGTGVTDHMCCAEVLGAALYKSKIMDLKEATEYQTASAPGLGRLLKSKGWTLITNAKELQPGDVLFYQKLVDASSAGVVQINGEGIHTCHTDIYYGDGKKVSTGGGFNKSNLLNEFNVNTSCYKVSAKWRYAFRYPGKK